MSSFHFLKSYNRVKKFSGGVHFKIIFGKIRGREMQSVWVTCTVAWSVRRWTSKQRSLIYAQAAENLYLNAHPIRIIIGGSRTTGCNGSSYRGVGAMGVRGRTQGSCNRS